MQKTIYPLESEIAKEGTFSGPLAFANGVQVEGGKLLFVSGQLAFDDRMQIIGKGDMGAQTRQVLENIKKALTAAGATFKDIIRVQVFVTDLTDFRAVHDVRLEYFDPDHLPASTLIQVAGLAHADALIEIDAVAAFE
jgi:2-iminobutanoate/2-iminopropanoate deaminase